jgi:hypothetical protein
VYANAIASVSPGEAGLSLIQSLGFGVPMILARDEPHGPELEAASEGENVLTFARGSASALADLLVDVAASRELWHARRDEIAAPIVDRYCLDNMVASFVGALGLAPAPSPRSSPESAVR